MDREHLNLIALMIVIMRVIVRVVALVTLEEIAPVMMTIMLVTMN